VAVGDVCGGLPEEHRANAVLKDGRLPFVYEASGSETQFTNGFDPYPRARKIFNFQEPRPWLGSFATTRTTPTRRRGGQGPRHAGLRPLFIATRPARFHRRNRRFASGWHALAFARADGDRSREDANGGHRGLPTASVRRVQPHFVPSGPQTTLVTRRFESSVTSRLLTMVVSSRNFITLTS